MLRFVFLIAVSFCLIGWRASAAQPAADRPYMTAAKLLTSQMFPDAQYGMSVEGAEDAEVARITTTGAEFLIDKAHSQIECRQRIAKQRAVAKLHFPDGALKQLSLTHKSSGAAIYSGGGATIRINGDSLLMMSLTADGAITAELAFMPDYYVQFKGNFNFFDPFGGISFFDHGQEFSPKLEAKTDPVKVTWSLKANDVLWAGVSPPKPYDWENSIHQRMVNRGSSSERYMYPDELTFLMLSRAAKFNIFYLHAENIMVSWQRTLLPKDPEAYHKLMLMSKLEKMPVMVYASPKHYLTGLSVQDRGTDDVDDPRSAGDTSGGNANMFVFSAKRLIERLGTTGLYFDEMYCNSAALASNYYVTRSCRALLGDDGAFMFHSTEDVMGDRRGPIGVTDCPTIHAYFSAIYKGEGIHFDKVDELPGYLRYNLGTYNISNTIAIPCFLYEWPDKAMLDKLMQNANARLVMPESYLYTDKSVIWWQEYLPRLTPQLKDQLEPSLLKPTGLFEKWRKEGNDQTDCAGKKL